MVWESTGPLPLIWEMLQPILTVGIGLGIAFVSEGIPLLIGMLKGAGGVIAMIFALIFV